MSRLEKKLNKKLQKKKYGILYKVVFLFIMIIITAGSILISDYRMNEMLQDDSKDSLIKYLNIFYFTPFKKSA